MATRHLSRSLFTATRQSLTSVFSRSYTAAAVVLPNTSTSFLLRLRPLVAVSCLHRLAPVLSTRNFSSRPTNSSLNDPNPNFSNRPPKETILLDGCDFEHWLVVVETPTGEPTRDEIIDSYIKVLASVLGSEEEARMKIYSVSTRHYFAFGALVSEEISYKLKELPGVRWVLPDSYLDVRNKDYGGEPFINGMAAPYDPKYHEEWVRNNARANERNRRNDRPRNFDRARNFERRRDVQMNQNSGGPGGNMGGSGGNMGGPPPNNGPMQPNMPMQHQPNMQQQPNYNAGAPPMNRGNYPPPNQYGNGPNDGRMPPYQSGPGPNQNFNPNAGSGFGPNMGPTQGQNQNFTPNAGYGPGQNQGGYVSNARPPPGQNQGGYVPNMGPGPVQNQNGYASPNGDGGNIYENQNVSGRDMPQPPRY